MLASVLGGLVGWEREWRNKQAGFKTHLLVSLGAALIMLTSGYGYAGLMNELNQHLSSADGVQVRFDPTRIAAQVVSGIGFLGAGAILRRSNMVVSGLTTAATLWVVAAIGLSVGAGFYIPAVVTTVIVLISVVLLRGLETKFTAKNRIRKLQIVFEDTSGALSEISEVLEEEPIDIRHLSISKEKKAEDTQEMAIKLRAKISSKKNFIKIVDRLQAIDSVIEVRYFGGREEE